MIKNVSVTLAKCIIITMQKFLFIPEVDRKVALFKHIRFSHTVRYTVLNCLDKMDTISLELSEQDISGLKKKRKFP